MLKKLLRKLKGPHRSSILDASPNPQNQSETVPVPKSIRDIKSQLHRELGASTDLVIREFRVGCKDALLVYIDGMADSDQVNEHLMGPLMRLESANISLPILKDRYLAAAQVSDHGNFKNAILEMLAGQVILALEGCQKLLTINAPGFPNRAVEESATESVVRGPRDGFTENIRQNTAMIRRRINTPNLVIQGLSLGEYSRTKIALAWIDGIAEPKLVNEIKTRLDRIEIDAILESGYIEEFIEDNPRSPFPQIRTTERPDKTAADLFEGKVAIFTDNTPFVMTLPVCFWQFLQANEDYYERPFVGTALRLLRYFALLISLLLPALYVAATTFHPEMIQTSLALSIAGTRDGIPFPAVVEALIMEISFEALREAGVRLPKPVGQAVSIVGALVVGQAAVEAGLVSPAMVIVVAGTAIASFVIPYNGLSITMRLLRFPMLLAAGFIGLYGILSVLFVIVLHLCSLRSLGQPYMSPLAPINISDLKDVNVRFPMWAMYSRPWLGGKLNRTRMSRGGKPRFHDNREG